MYGDSIILYGRLIKFVLVYVVVEIAVQIVSERASSSSWTSVVSIFNWAALSFVAHQSVLFPGREDVSFGYQRLFMGFAGRTLALCAIAIVPAMIVVVIVTVRLTGHVEEDVLIGSVIGIMMLGMLLLALVIFPLFGTWLPAHVMQDQNRGLGSALARGKKTFGFTASRMLAGPVPVYAVSVVLTLANLNRLSNNLLSDSWEPDVFQIMFLVVLYLVQALAAIMTAWILSHTYLRSRPERTTAVFE